ncbi:gfo/Idh/MocA family oxidoreductase [Paenibacillus psychroresistens]|uniref:Gfo/Idh/MocA family oxidoreductase n=1 Tax=Paenibacillus psychroresistens TaxID=1778678 RepID=A0A6B8RIL7_9BACL|nr:Gfo/Idh/MocA family oxidoreductase [Paenibacillus psychroresistens]QGQ95445.1 gfo/Idh/MocA family oxidoreductase [Paenibacillus psychroresistens]
MTRQGKLKVALVGAGGTTDGKGLSGGFKSPGSWGHQHARIFSTRPDVDFCAIVGRDPEKTQRKAIEYGTNSYTSISDMLEKETPDLVSMCLPNQDHFKATLQVIQAGFPLLVEKPLVFDLKEADILLNEAAKRNLFFAINLNHRFAKPVQLAYDAIKNGKLGDLTFASWRFGGEGASEHPHANLIETQCHGIDMLEYLCGPIESVMAEMTDKTGGGFRTLSLALKFTNGAVGSLIGTYDSSYAYPDTQRVELDGTKGRIVIHDTVKRYTYNGLGNELGEVWEAGYFNDEDRDFHRTFDNHIDKLLQALRAGEQPPVHAKAGYRALLVADAAIRSYQSGSRIKI